MTDQPEVRVTFEQAAPLLQHILADELRAEGFTVLPGPPPEEQRGGREVIETLNVGITILGKGLVLAGTGSLVVKIERAIRRAVGDKPAPADDVFTIRDEDGNVRGELRLPGKDER